MSGLGPSSRIQHLPPLQPSYVLRGHGAAVSSVCFIRQNTRLLTGDQDGWAVLWNLPIKRPTAVWRAHDGPVLALGAWGSDKIVTHGRDGKLNVWQLTADEEASFSKQLPATDPSMHRKKPWLLHSLPVNTLNFCAFTMCQLYSSTGESERSKEPEQSGDSVHDNAVLVAVPAAREPQISLVQLPQESRSLTTFALQGVNTGGSSGAESTIQLVEELP